MTSHDLLEPAARTHWHRVLWMRVRHVFGIDPRSLALFRVALGALMLTDLILRSRDLTVFYTDQGVLPRAAWGELAHRWHLSLHAASGELWWQVLLFVLAAVAALAVMVGYRTRVATLVSLLLLGSLMNRNTLVLQGGDQLLVVMCFWAVFLPTGMRWSVDAVLAQSAKPGPDAPDSPGAPDPQDARTARVDGAMHSDGGTAPWFGVASVAALLQVLYLYLFTAILKTGAPWREDHDAAFRALSLQQFATPIGEWLTGFPLLLKAATRFVLVVEFLAPLLVLSAVFYLGRGRFARFFALTRLGGLALLASLHVAFILMLHIGLFPLIDLMSLTLLLPAAAWVWLSRVGKPLRHRIDAWYPEWRGRLTAFLRSRLPASAPVRVHPSLAGSLLAGCFLYVVTAFNVWDLPGVPGRMPEHVERPARWLRIDQRWNMFAPYPLADSLYPLVPGLLRSGEIVDLHRRTSSAGDWAAPGRFYGLYDNYRWRKYLGRVDRHGNDTVRRAYGAYHCRAWNGSERPHERQLGVLEVNFVSLRTTTDGTPKVESRRQVWRHWCYTEFKDRRIEALPSRPLPANPQAPKEPE